MSVFTRSAAVGLAVVAGLTVAACGGGTTAGSVGTTTTTPSTAAPAIGMMSGGMTSAMPTAVSSASNDNSVHNDADVLFAQQMIVHHQGAIEMAEWAATRAGTPQVNDLAASIAAAQAPEIKEMTGWLQAWGATDHDQNAMPNPTTSSSAIGGMSGMDHDGTVGAESATETQSMQMPGMMRSDDMSALSAAAGIDFDTMFLQMMIVNHQGAIEMSDTEIRAGSNVEALALAESIKSSQTAEITTMQGLLAAR